MDGLDIVVNDAMILYAMSQGKNWPSEIIQDIEDEDDESKYDRITIWDATTQGPNIGTKLVIWPTYYGWRAEVSDGGHAGFITDGETPTVAARLALSGYLAIVNGNVG